MKKAMKGLLPPAPKFHEWKIGQSILKDDYDQKRVRIRLVNFWGHTVDYGTVKLLEDFNSSRDRSLEEVTRLLTQRAEHILREYEDQNQIKIQRARAAKRAATLVGTYR